APARYVDHDRLLPAGSYAGAARSHALRSDFRVAPEMGARSDTGAPRPFRIFRPGGTAPGRLTVGGRARAARARDPDVVGRQPADSGRADESSGRRIDRGAGGRARRIR